MRLRHDVWPGEISFSKTQQAEKKMGFRREDTAAWGIGAGLV